jgi:hypothetical protein
MRKSSAALAVSLLAQGCALVRHQQAIDAQSALVGRTRPEVMACAGIPTKVSKSDGKEVDTYSVAARYLVSGVILGVRNCTVRIVFDEGRVSAVHYIIEDPGILAPFEECAEIVATCLR